MSEEEQQVRIGVFSAMLAYTIWGFFPIYFKVVESAGSLEVLAHRVIWAVPFGALILYFRKQWPEVIGALTNRKTLTGLALAALIISVNWGLYIWAVQSERIFQASLGYYINPLVFVLVGVLVGGETLSRLQIAAVVFAVIGVSILTLYGGTFPWVSFVLAFSFTAYGYIRKNVVIGAMPGLFIETVLLLLPALLFWGWLINNGKSTFTSDGVSMAGLLMLAGPFTVLPLLFFAIGARRLRLSTIGFLQYIGPTLQFCVGLYYGEEFTLAHALCFSAIWIAVAIYSVDAWQKNQRAKTLASAKPLDDTIESDEFIRVSKEATLNEDNR